MPAEGAPSAPRTVSRVAKLLALFAVASTLVVAAWWALQHPYGTSWDESLYLDFVALDLHAARTTGFFRALAAIMVTPDNRYPPAFRLVALPFTYVAGADPRALRLLSLSLFAVTLLLLHRLVARYGGARAALFALLLFGLGLGPIWACMRFGTEYVLFLALAGALASATVCLTEQPAPRWAWPAFALSVALGALAKMTFFVAGGAALATAVVLSIARGGRKRPVALLLAGAAGLLLAAPYWLVNGREAVRMARYASHFIRHNYPLAPDVARNLIGPPATLLFVAALVLVALRLARTRAALPGPRGLLVASGVAGAVPLVAAQIASLNHNSRLMAPAFLLATIAIALLLEDAIPARAAVSLGRAAGLLFLLQAVYVDHNLLSAHVEQWDWDRLRVMCSWKGLPRPSIAHLGQGTVFNPPAIQYPWTQRGVQIDESWLWRYERGPIDWDKLDRDLKPVDVVITAPGFTGDRADKHDLDNVHNDELVERLRASHEFEEPAVLRMGDEGTRLLIFFRRSR